MIQIHRRISAWRHRVWRKPIISIGEVHVALWVASQAKNIEGDFVECGVNKGFFTSCIMRYTDWNSLNKRFFLLDTFRGIDEKYMSDAEKKKGKLEAP